MTAVLFSMATSKTITLQEFLGIVKVARMLYGVEVATHYFEKNIQEFSGHEPSDFKSMLTSHDAHDNLESPRDTQKL